MTHTILANLEDDLEEEAYKVGQDMELRMPELEWDTLKLNGRIPDMESAEFWQQKGMQC